MQVVMKAIKEQTKERGAERAALTITHLLNSGLSSRASHLHRENTSWLESSATLRKACQAMADGLLVLVPHKTLHGTISILVQ